MRGQIGSGCGRNVDGQISFFVHFSYLLWMDRNGQTNHFGWAPITDQPHRSMYNTEFRTSVWGDASATISDGTFISGLVFRSRERVESGLTNFNSNVQ